MKKKSRKLSDYPKNVPRALIREYRLAGENGLKLSKKLGVNDAHLSKLLKYGIEPVDNSIRIKLMLSPNNICKTCGRKIIKKKTKKDQPPEPEYMKTWKRLPKTERHAAIIQYTVWRLLNKDKVIHKRLDEEWK